MINVDMPFFERKIHKALKSHLDEKQVTILTGMRRTGKTTLVNKLLSEINSNNKIFLDFQNLANRDIFLDRDQDNIIRTMERRGINSKLKMYVAIDEIQLVPESSGAIKYLYDHYDIKFILTGSSSYYLKNLFSESLAGRKQIFELAPLDFGEFLTFKNVTYDSATGIDKNKNVFTESFDEHEYERLKVYYEEYVRFGGFPEVVIATSDEQKKRLLEDILSSYINIDIKSLSDFKESTNIVNLVRMLTGRIGTRLDVMKISRLIGMSRQTVQNYINLFEKTYLIYILPVFSNNPDREIVKAKKLYFSDTGLVSVFADVSGGSLFENAVHNQLRVRGELAYYSLRSGKEIDFILNKELAIEAKESPTETDRKDLEALTQKARLNKSRLIGRNKTPKFQNYIWGGSIK